MKLTKNISTIMSYLTIGMLTALIYFSCFTVLWKLMGMNYQIVTSIAYALAVLFHFTTNRYFTFKSQGANLLQHITKYSMTIIINFIITLIIMYIAVEFLKVSPYIGMLLSISITVCTGFFLSRYWIFRRIPSI